MMTTFANSYPMINTLVGKIAEGVDTKDKAAMRQLMELGVVDVTFDGKEVRISIKCDQLEGLLEAEFGKTA